MRLGLMVGYWMFGPEDPIDLVLENEIGGELVRDVLGRLEHGSAV